MASPVQLTLDLGDGPGAAGASGRSGSFVASGLPEMNGAERVRAELSVLGLDASRHVLDGYAGFLDALGVTRSRELLRRRSRAEILVAGVKVATQTPPIRSGRRVIFVTLDDSTGPVDATFFENAQVGYAATLFHSWLLVVRGRLRRTGERGVSLLASGCWELPVLHAAWEEGGLAAVEELLAAPAVVTEQAVAGAAESRASRPVVAHPTGFLQSSYSDIRPAGDDAKSAPRKLWHSSPGSAGG
jgi:error-prone DNA polymerase